MSLKYVSVPTKTLARSLNSSGMSLRVSDIKGWNKLDLTESDFGTIAYVVLRDAANSLIEIIEIDATTIAAGNITINKRGLKFEGDRTTEVAANKLSWVQGSTLVDLGVDTPQMLQTLQENFEAAVIAGGVPATTSVLGLNRMSTAPVDPAVPIALGENDGRVPTADEKDALAGGGDFGTPDTDNKYITEAYVGSRFSDVVTFLASGTWTKDAGLKRIRVQAWGGGGSGGARNTDHGGGGGGGGYADHWFEASELGATETVTIGAGGAGASRGFKVGGNTTFGTLLTAWGGGGGLGGSSSSEANGGGGGGADRAGNNANTGTGGTSGVFASDGGDGENAEDAFYGAGGGSAYDNGGASIYGGGGGGASGGGVGGTSVHGGAGGDEDEDGSVPGGGGGGSSTATAGNGGNGQVIVTEYYS